MDPITAVGFAAAILQFTSFAANVVKRIADFESAIDQTQAPKAFRQIKTELPLVVDGLRRIKVRIDAGEIDGETKTALVPVVQECQRSVTQLNELLDLIIPPADASSWERKVKAISSLTKDKKVDDIADTLHKYVGVLTFHQVVDNVGRVNLETTAAKPPQVFWLVPFDRNNHFVDREGIFQRINNAYAVREGSQPRAALCGLGGIGKSQVALEYCFIRREQNPLLSVFWINAATAARFEESMMRIASNCGLMAGGASHAESVLNVKNWLETKHKSPWLMVIDNVDDEAAFFRDKMLNGKTPSQSLPRTSQGTLLFTTRSADVAVDVATPSAPITIAELSKEEGLSLVRAKLQQKSDDKVILDFLSELNYIPLAITQALAFILKRRKTITQYLQQYRTNDDTKTRLLAYEFSEHGRDSSSMESVAKTWAISFEWIKETNSRAADMLCLVAFFQHQGIPRELLLKEGEDEFDFEDAFALLQAFSFLSADDAGSTFDTHRLVQLATKWWLRGESQFVIEGWALMALRSVAAHFPPPTTLPPGDYWMACERNLPHADLLLQYSLHEPIREWELGKVQLPAQELEHEQARLLAQDFELEKARLLAHTGKYLHWNGHYERGRLQFALSYQIRQERLGKSNSDTLQSMGLLAWAHGVGVSGGDNTLAIDLGRQAFDLRTSSLGADHPDTIDSLSDLATAYSNDGQYSLSEDLQRDALARSTRVLGHDHSDTANCMSHLAGTLYEQQRYDEAVELQQDVYRIKVKLFGANHQDTLIAEDNLARFLSNTEKSEEALQHGSHALDGKLKLLGADHPETLISAINLFDYLVEQARADEAHVLRSSILADCNDSPRRGNLDTERYIAQLGRRKGRMQRCNCKHGKDKTRLNSQR